MPLLPLASIMAARDITAAASPAERTPGASRAFTTPSHCQEHIRAGVAVRHREDVQRVDDIDVRLQEIGREGHILAKLRSGDDFRRGQASGSVR